MKNLFLIVFCGLLISLIACAKQSPEDELVAKVVTAMGGADKLDAITDQVSKWDFKMAMVPGAMEGEEGEGEMAEGEGMSMPMVITYKKPNKLRFDFIGPDGSVQQSSCFDGTTGWSNFMGQKMEMKESQLQETEEMAKNWVDGFLHYKDKGYTLELLADETMDGQNYKVVQAQDKYGNIQNYYINAQTYQIERQVGEMTNYQGEKESMYMTFNDYKMVDGIALAHHVAQYKENGDMMWEATLTEAKHNTSVEDDAFMAEAMTMK